MKKGRSAGEIAAYETLDAALSPPSGGWRLEGQEIRLNSISVEENDFFQGVLPVYRNGSMAGRPTP